MALGDSLFRWLSILEAEYGVSAGLTPATSEEIAELEDHWNCEIGGELRELLEISNGFFRENYGDLLPRTYVRPASEVWATFLDPAESFAYWVSEADLDYIETRPCEFEDLLHLATGVGHYLGVISQGPARDGVWAFDPDAPLFEWVAPSLSQLFDNCVWYYEQGYFEFHDAEWFRIRQELRTHPNLEHGWTIMPFEPEYDGPLPIGAWRW